VIAAEPDRIHRQISKAAVLERMRTDQDFAVAISARFAGQIQDYRRRIEITAIRNASDRVFAAVADGLLSRDIKSFAGLIGLSHEATYRALAALTQQGRLIKTGRGTYALPEPDHQVRLSSVFATSIRTSDTGTRALLPAI
jgi:hypothetical protein